MGVSPSGIYCLVILVARSLKLKVFLELDLSVDEGPSCISSFWELSVLGLRLLKLACHHLQMTLSLPDQSLEYVLTYKNLSN